ncbi:MAG: hypothetical protein U1E65_26220 [Myxococcota bacterium]
MEKSDIARVILERMRSERGKADHRAFLERSWAYLLGSKIGQLLPEASLSAAVRAHLTPDRVAELVRPWAGAVLRAAVEEIQSDREPLSRYVPKAAEEAIGRIAARPGLVDPGWLRALFKEKAIEAMVSDTLYAAIRDFSTGIPKLLLSLLPTRGLGVLGTAAGIGTRIVDEVEKRLEPEIRSFLVGGTKRALERTADFAIAHLEDPTSVELRRNIVRFFLSQSPHFHTRALDGPVLNEIAVAAEAIARRVGERPESADDAQRWIGRFYAAWGERSLDELLKALDLRLEPDLAAIAEASWPFMEHLLASPAVVELVEARVAEVLELAPQ